jgi:hypothetical protein
VPRCRRKIEFGDWSPLVDEIRECAISDNLVATSYLRQQFAKRVFSEPFVPTYRASQVPASAVGLATDIHLRSPYVLSPLLEMPPRRPKASGDSQRIPKRAGAGGGDRNILPLPGILARPR